MKTVFVAFLVAGIVAAALLAQAVSAELPHCTVGYCAPYDTGR